MIRTITTLTAFAIMSTSSATFAQDLKAGEKLFKKCAACHQIGDGARNGAGPVLTGVIGRTAGTYPGFKYSKSMRAAGEAGHVWDQESIIEYIENPTKYLRHLLDDPRAKAKMRFKLKSVVDRRLVVAYVASFSQTTPEDESAKLFLDELPPTDTPGKLCVTNGEGKEHFFIVEAGETRKGEMLAPGGQLCIDSDQGGKIGVFATADDLEGCTRVMPENTSDTLVRYMEFDRCTWGEHLE